MSPQPPMERPRPIKAARNDVIAELKQSYNVGGVSKLKTEQARLQEEEEREEQRRFMAQFTVENYLEKIPLEDPSGAKIPHWKREMLAKKAAEKAKRLALEKRSQDEQNKKMAAIPEWKRNLIGSKQKNMAVGDSDAKRRPEILANGHATDLGHGQTADENGDVARKPRSKGRALSGEEIAENFKLKLSLLNKEKNRRPEAQTATDATSGRNGDTSGLKTGNGSVGKIEIGHWPLAQARQLKQLEEKREVQRSTVKKDLEDIVGKRRSQLLALAAGGADGNGSGEKLGHVQTVKSRLADVADTTANQPTNGAQRSKFTKMVTIPRKSDNDQSSVLFAIKAFENSGTNYDAVQKHGGT